MYCFMSGKGDMCIKKKKSVGNILLNIVIIGIVLAGISLLAYPTVANWWNARHNSHAMAVYQETVADMNAEEYVAMWSDAEAYNLALQKKGQSRWKPTKTDSEVYNSLLNPGNLGIMAYVDIPKISVKLPVYHGTDETTLAVAVGHLEGSSLPAGGIGTHVIMSGHSALPSARLFTDLNKVEVGDRFYLHTLDAVLAYEVREINVVLPHEFEYFAIDPERDLCTLVTCTPYGVNSHRLLVTGERTEYVSEDNAEVSEEAKKPDSDVTSVGLSTEQKVGIGAIGVSVIALGLFSIIVNHKPGKKGK